MRNPGTSLVVIHSVNDRYELAVKMAEDGCSTKAELAHVEVSVQQVEYD